MQRASSNNALSISHLNKSIRKKSPEYRITDANNIGGSLPSPEVIVTLA